MARSRVLEHTWQQTDLFGVTACSDSLRGSADSSHCLKHTQRKILIPLTLSEVQFLQRFRQGELRTAQYDQVSRVRYTVQWEEAHSAIVGPAHHPNGGLRACSSPAWALSLWVFLSWALHAGHLRIGAGDLLTLS